jgi:hypothetical protein
MPNEPIFFSYSRSDSEFVLKLAKDLRKAGANIWLDQLDIKPGSHWDSSIETALNKSTDLIIILSPASVASNNVMDEVSFALETNKTVIPVLLAECEVPFRLRRVQRVNFTGDYQAALNQLMDVLGYSRESSEQATIKKQPDLSEVISAETKPVAEQKEKEPEASVWKNAKAENTLDALKQYLQQFPHGAYQTEALEAIKNIEDNKKQKAVERSTFTNSSVKEIEKKPISRKYVFIGIGAFIAALVLWIAISSNSEKSNNDKANDNGDSTSEVNKLDQANTYFDSSQYGSAWSIYISLDTNKIEDTTALANIGDLYYNGNAVTRDYAQAKIWYEKAAAAGSGYAMYSIGYLYYYGYGVTQDHAQAKIWYEKACNVGIEDACKGLDSLSVEK